MNEYKIIHSYGGERLIDKKEQLLTAGRQLFSEKGFKDTNVSEITKLAGMATGTFYNYYSSKDKLFMDLYNEENIKLKRTIMNEVNLDEQPHQLIGQIMALNTAGMKTNPILKEWYNKEVFQRIEKVFREEKGVDQVEFSYSFFPELIKKWQDEGKMRDDISPDMVMAIFGAIVNIDTHKEEIGIEYFPQLMEYLMAFVMKGLGMDIQ